MSRPSSSPLNTEPDPSSLISQLRRLSGSLWQEDRLTFERAGRQVHARVIGGMVFLSVRLPEAPLRTEDPQGGAYRSVGRAVVAARRPLEIGLCPETADHLASKREGINRELTVGDAEFDQEVYFHTNCEEEVVRGVFRDERARAAALVLVRENPAELLVDDVDGDVRLVLSGAQVPGPLDRAERLVDALVALVHALPELSTFGVRSPRWTYGQARAFAIFLCVPGAVACALVTALRCDGYRDEDGFFGIPACLELTIGAAFVGALLGAGTYRALRGHIRGQYHSLTIRRYASVLLPILVAELTAIVVGCLR